MADEYKIKLYDSIFKDMQEYIISNIKDNKITDLNAGSVIHTFLGAISSILESGYIETRVGFQNQLLQLPRNAFNFFPIPGLKSSVSVKFSVDTSSATLINIPIGTIISTQEQIEFSTQEEAVISIGQLESNVVQSLSVIAGVSGNVAEGTVVVIVTEGVDASGVVSVSTGTGGLNEEDPSSFAERFSDYILGLSRSNIYGLKAIIESTDNNIIDASIIELIPPAGGYHAKIILNNGSGTALDDEVNSVKDLIEGTLEVPGYKAVGLHYDYLSSTTIGVDVTGIVTQDGFFSESILISNIKESITNLFNNLRIGDDVVIEDIECAMDVDGVKDRKVTEVLVEGGVNTDRIINITDEQTAVIQEITITIGPIT